MIGLKAIAVIIALLHGIAVDNDGNVVVTSQGEQNSVIVMSRKGEKITEFGSDRLVNPAGLAVDSKGRIIVANSGKNEITIFDSTGKYLVSGTGLANPQEVAIGPNGMIYVADPGNSRIAVFEASGDKIAFSIDKVDTGEGEAPLKNPMGVAVSGKVLAISDTGNHRVLLMECPKKASEGFQATVITEIGMDPKSIVIGGGGRIYVADRNIIQGYTRGGKRFGEYRAKNGQWFQPGTLAVDKHGKVHIADKSTCRVFVTDPMLTDVMPELKLDEKDPTTVTILWKSSLPQPTVVKYGTTEMCEMVYNDKKPETNHKVVLKGLKPATRYYYHIYAPVEIIPLTTKHKDNLPLDIQRKSWKILSQGYSPEYAFATLPEKGMTDWVAAPTVILVYKRVTFPAGADGKKPEDRVLDDNDITLLKNEMETYRVWAWRHSSLKMSFDFTWIIVDGPRDNSQLGGISKTVFDDILKGVTAQGKDLHDFWYVDVVGTHGWYALYLSGTVAGTEYELGSCYTGFGHGQKPGWWWFPTHEHGHLVHSWLMCSGVGTFAFPDAPWTLDGQFGENFSFLAANYRTQPVRSWLTLKRSVINQSIDANGNGVPDDDPRVPLDEKRFGWTKKMGGDCLKRIMAGGRTPGYAGSTDTDFEGKVHKLNEGELHWINRHIKKTVVKIDGKLDSDEYNEFYSIPNITTPENLLGLKTKLYLAWDNDNYYIAIKSDKKVIAGFDLDGANDGWFHGRDNLRFSVRPAMDGRQLEVSGAIWDFLNNVMNIHNGQHWYKEAYKPGDIVGATGEQDGWYIIECAVPARRDIGIDPGLNSQFGLRAYLWTESKEGTIPQTGFFDGEDFIYNIRCVKR